MKYAEAIKLKWGYGLEQYKIIMMGFVPVIKYWPGETVPTKADLDVALLEYAISEKKVEIEKILDEKSHSHFVCNCRGEAHAYSLSTDAKMNVDKIVQKMTELVLPDPYPYVCMRLSDGMTAPFNHTLDQMRGVDDAGVLYISALWETYFIKIAEAEACATLAEVETVVWT